jgi:hypothetical protein
LFPHRKWTMTQNYSDRFELSRHYAMNGERPLGALNHTYIRAYVFPFYSPAGVIMLQECPPDHMHHQGIGVGQDYVNGHNFWAQLALKHPLNQQAGQLIKIESDDNGITYTLNLHWVTVDGQHIINELRVVRFEAWEGCNFLEVQTSFTAAYGDVFFGQTKEGGLTMRVAQQLETAWGGTIRSSEGFTGGEKVFDTIADWVEISGRVGPNDVGIVFMPHPSMEKVPWFTRDYGLHNYGPFRHKAWKLPFRESFQWRAGFAAYDGESDGSQVADAWEKYSNRKS